MKKRAIIYTRVSTKEQGENGYSLRDQEANLRSWCAQKDIEVIAHYQDDFTGKTFERPSFKRLLEFIKTNKPDYVLFAKWDRFSRVAMDAHNMIDKFLKKGIEANAVEQWIIHDIPEHKILLGIYVSVPESDNLRRGMNTKAGMHRARQEGRWPGQAPLGYVNTRIDGKAYIIPGPEADEIREAFEQVAAGIYAIESVFVRLKRVKKLAKCSRSQLYRLLRNPVYAGYVQVNATKTHPAYQVKGYHEPLISIDLFNQVQDIIDGRKRNAPKSNTLVEDLQLRGFLICPKCGRTMTGSGSAGRNKVKHFYYHCVTSCGARFRADDANESFVRMLQQNAIPAEVLKLYFKVLKDVTKSDNTTYIRDLNRIEAEIQKTRQRILANADMFIDRDIDRETFESNKSRYNEMLLSLQNEKENLDLRSKNIDAEISFGLSLLEKPHFYYKEADLIAKREIVGSIFPEKLVYDGSTYRTANSGIFALLTLNKPATKQKPETRLLQHVALGTPDATILEPAEQFLNHLERIFKLKDRVKVREIEFV